MVTLPPRQGALRETDVPHHGRGKGGLEHRSIGRLGDVRGDNGARAAESGRLRCARGVTVAARDDFPSLIPASDFFVRSTTTTLLAVFFYRLSRRLAEWKH